MKTFLVALLFAAAPLAAAACTSTSGGGGYGGSPVMCAASTDCGSGEICGFPEVSGCAAIGRCFAAPGAVCEAYAAGCACDGTTINIACTGLPEGYATKPLAYAHACNDACAASYVCLSTVVCATDADCASLGSTCDPCMKLCGCGVADAGPCCPSAWMMYACTFPDGGSGLACHDPGLGCASSTTCGAGCDSVVVGRCGDT
jgi:hypothetical protein